MLHHAVLHANWCDALPALIPPRPNVIGYLQLLAHSYYALINTAASTQNAELHSRPLLLVDCACGVGFAAVQGFRNCLQTLGCVESQRFMAVNPPGAGPLNDGCGSEHVQKSLQPPTIYSVAASSATETNTVASDGSYCCSLDGDADRIVFFSREPSFYLMDGDKMATLICTFVREQLDALQAPIRVGVVQTAYANGASTEYLRRFLGKESVAIAKTGVKFVHAAAHQFDIGVYFEANGHGTIVFGGAFYDYVATFKPVNASARTALARLCVLPSLVNQAVGDALSDMLLIDAILCLQNMSIQEWNDMYTDLPSRQLKVQVKDRSIIKVNDNETQCHEPQQVQGELDRAMNEHNGRAFIRPSGTEDVVRIYAEAPTRAAADELAKIAAGIVHRLCGGDDTTPSSKL
jgi:phosphoacetylglucosamine mutase